MYRFLITLLAWVMSITNLFSASPFSGDITGTVRDFNGNPVGGVTVQVLFHGALIAQTTSSSLGPTLGQYTVTDLQQHQYVVTAIKSGYTTTSVGANVKNNRVVVADITFPNTSPTALSGTVSRASPPGTLSGATVNIATTGGVDVAQLTTDGSGNYTIDLPAGSYAVTASYPGYTSVTQVVTMAGSPQTLNFVLSNATPPGSFTGTVSDSVTSNPLPGAVVTAYQNNIPVGSAVSNGSGVYTIANLAPGNYLVTASLPNYQDATLGGTINSGAATTLNFSMLANPGSIEGHVRTGGTAIPAATVQVLLNNVVIASTVTDGSGAYTFGSLAPATYVIRASATNYVTAQQGVTLTAGQTLTNVDFDLVANPGSISGTVSFAGAPSPLPTATVQVLLNNVVVGSTLTLADGSYSLGNLAPGTYIVQASATGYQTGLTSAIVTAGTNTPNVNLTLAANPGSISGTVSFSDAPSPRPTATVQVLLNNVVVATTVTDGSGNYTVGNLAAGVYSVQASATNYAAAQQGATVVAGGATTGVNFTLIANPGSISGTVSFAGSPSPLPTATVEVLLNNIVVATTVTDGSGSYLVGNLPSGVYVVRASATNYVTAQQGATVVAGTATTGVNFLLAANPGSISGTVSFSGSPSPLPTATVEVLLNNIVVATTVTDGSGNYAVGNLAPGTYIVRGSASGYQTGLTSAIVTAGTNTPNVNLTLAASPRSISGRVDNGTVALPGATVEALLNNVLVASVVTDGNGDYLIPNLGQAIYSVRASATNYSPQIQTASTQTGNVTNLDFHLISSLGTLSGTVTDSVNGSFISGCLIEVSQNNVVLFTTLTGPNGQYLFPGIPQGTYVVRASASNYQTGTQGAVIASNYVANFALIPSPGAIAGLVTDSGSVGIAGATVNVRLANLIVFTTVTGGAGDYQILGVAPGTYSVQVIATNYVAQTQPAVVQSNQTTTVNFTLASGGASLTGVVRSSSMVPIANALIEVNTLGGDVLLSTFTLADGSYSITGIPVGDFRIHAHASGYQTSMAPLSVTGNFSYVRDFILQTDPASLVGVVSDALTGGALAGALVEVEFNGVFFSAALTDPNGVCLLSGFPPGNYTVRVSKGGYQSASSVVFLSIGETTTVYFALIPNGAVLPPRNLRGCGTLNRFLLQAERIDRIQWDPSLDPSVVGYRVFRNKQLIAELPSSSCLCEQICQPDCGCAGTLYTVIAVTGNGMTSAGTSIVVK